MTTMERHHRSLVAVAVAVAVAVVVVHGELATLRWFQAWGAA